MKSPDQSIAILFADVCGSVSLYGRLGDDAASGKIAQLLELLTGVVASHGGRVVKTIGDEIMCTFPDAAAAVQAAMEMPSRLDLWQGGQTDGLRIRVGLHAGEAIERDGDVFGNAVNLAARVAAVATDNQVITTADTVAQLPDALRGAFRSLGPVYIKGKTEAVELFQFIGEEEDSTGIVPPSAGAAPRYTLTVSYRGHTFTVDQQHPGLHLGRNEDNDLVDDQPLASRRHGRIELRGHRFVLVDQSSNGSYVEGASYDGIQRCHRGELPLMGRGVIALGRPHPDPELDIGFTCVESVQ